MSSAQPSLSQPVAAPQLSPEEIVQRVAKARELLLNEVHKVIIGQDEMIEQMLICIFARGHCLTIGVPGLAKTLTVSTLAKALHLKFSRIQFTPDLMPSDITGTEIIDQDPSTGQRYFRFVKGPIFANIVLADEINRTPPKTQAALLQAMQEYEVTVAGKTYPLEQPFFVMATQNPIEQEGTYPLPEAQLDRFMLSIHIGYPTRDEEREIVMTTTQPMRKDINPVLSGKDILWIQHLVRQVPASQHMVDYAVDIVRATRPKDPSAPDFVKNYLAWGAGPRAAQNIILTAKARAILHGRYAVTAEDVRAVVFPVLRHRIFTNFNADAEGIDVDQIIERILNTVPEPTYGEHIPVRAPTRKGPAKEASRAAASVTPPPPPPPPPGPIPPPAESPLSGGEAEVDVTGSALSPPAVAVPKKSVGPRE
ncbi:MAG: MoxR family ATPase [Thermoguttaceae bacterium]|nr:MoxR family ATPase [Thermoguttaceae bacterium]